MLFRSTNVVVMLLSSKDSPPDFLLEQNLPGGRGGRCFHFGLKHRIPLPFGQKISCAPGRNALVWRFIAAAKSRVLFLPFASSRPVTGRKAERALARGLMDGWAFGWLAESQAASMYGIARRRESQKGCTGRLTHGSTPIFRPLRIWCTGLS